MIYPTKKLSEILIVLRNGKSCKQTSDSIGDKITRIETISRGGINADKVGYFELTQEDRTKYSIEKGDILFSHINSVEHIGKVAIAKQDYDDLFHGMNLLLLRADKNIIDPEFLYIILFTYFKKGYWRARCKKAINQASLNQKNLNELKIPLPSLPTQSLIVSRLDEAFLNIDHQITLLRANIADVENMRKSVLEESFQSGAYESRKFGEICDKITDGSHNPPKGGESGVPMISSRNIGDNTINFENIRLISEDDYQSENKRTDVKDGDILLSIVGTIGKVCIVRSDFGRFTMQRSLAVLKIQQKKVSPFFMYYYLSSDRVQKELNDGANGAAQKGIYLNQLKEILIPLPPLPIQHQIVAHLDSVWATTDQMRRQYEAQIRDLDSLRQSLLDDAFSGRLVPDEG